MPTVSAFEGADGGAVPAGGDGGNGEGVPVAVGEPGDRHRAAGPGGGLAAALGSRDVGGGDKVGRSSGFVPGRTGGEADGDLAGPVAQRGDRGCAGDGGQVDHGHRDRVAGDRDDVAQRARSVTREQVGGPPRGGVHRDVVGGDDRGCRGEPGTRPRTGCRRRGSAIRCRNRPSMGPTHVEIIWPSGLIPGADEPNRIEHAEGVDDGAGGDVDDGERALGRRRPAEGDVDPSGRGGRSPPRSRHRPRGCSW